jgi:hypothetical protein
MHILNIYTKLQASGITLVTLFSLHDAKANERNEQRGTRYGRMINVDLQEKLQPNMKVYSAQIMPNSANG